ncbi:MAG: type II toxin-antitoxin system VapC family toxin [Desulfobacterales bacterium]
MAMKILLDTSAYVGFKRNNVELVEMIIAADLILFSAVVLGELLFGFRGGTRFKKNLDELNSFLENDAVEIVSIGKISADRYSRIATQLGRQGTPIPTNDIWIAAQTMEHGAELITTDKHFDKISGLVYSRF